MLWDFAIIIFDVLRGTEGSIVLICHHLLVSLMIYQRDKFNPMRLLPSSYIGELHELTILANVTPVCQS